jgi:hypothetical protein
MCANGCAAGRQRQAKHGSMLSDRDQPRMKLAKNKSDQVLMQQSSPQHQRSMYQMLLWLSLFVIEFQGHTWWWGYRALGPVDALCPTAAGIAGMYKE